MVDSILFSQVGKREVVEVPSPTPVLGGDGKPVYAGGLPIFNIRNRNADYMYGETSSVSREFTRKYISASATRAKPIQLAVFFALAETAEWGECMIVVGDNHHPIMTSDVKAQAVMKTHGNRSFTRTIDQIAQEVKASYGAVQKALAFWESEEIMQRIKPYEQKSVIEEHCKSGRKIEFRRYEFDPFYVWNGPLWLRTAYGEIH
ncbi:hypothetical protein [Brucella anthropi]|uniref:Uncharacterized protein n=1 Tax=Brucella anthropi (strain ATCC 49188 / DSM 6882 / CCUG 24695 / JCM 21032 / LMG 3331 / NBRC 15819 / NCTC 12168 / Alc 37) TaxID=439375 RepID=A6X008_BRUA4|nr:hypothetical protein [Brucella anthropi]ABS14562.1 hypothetical protein Oant_1846 [Brucella anthropi ATCC 49188]AIK44687.1 hypothetical protein DR92_1333 [Brucella anthropi]KAB2739318.1 hypothetical protein F9K90_06060 [Brucella anthropi]KAB2753570.1 hypothetical protein F9K95_07030 [Brucella anthropi]KAB2783524.1 hypothetical protein F9K99_03050 [Brucella anthropi]